MPRVIVLLLLSVLLAQKVKRQKSFSCCVFCDFARFCNLQGCYHVFHLWTCHIGIVCSSFAFNLNNNVSYISCSNKLNMYELLPSLFFYISSSRLIQLNIMKNITCYWADLPIGHKCHGYICTN